MPLVCTPTAGPSSNAAAAAAAYGWPADITEEDALARLLALSLARSR
jgi:hypothetical protein